MNNFVPNFLTEIDQSKNLVKNENQVYSDKIPVTGFSDLSTLDFSLIGSANPKDIKFYLEQRIVVAKKEEKG